MSTLTMRQPGGKIKEDKLSFTVAVALTAPYSFPLGGSWHNSRSKERLVVTDEGYQSRIYAWVPLIRPSVRTGAPSPWGEGLDALNDNFLNS